MNVYVLYLLYMFKLFSRHLQWIYNGLVERRKFAGHAWNKYEICVLE